MNRRKFLQRLGLGATVVAVAPIAIKAACTCTSGFKPLIGTAEDWCEVHGTPLVECMPVLKDYVEYTNFSQFANCQEIDDLVMQAAKEEFDKRIPANIEAMGLVQGTREHAIIYETNFMELDKLFNNAPN